MEQNKEHLGQLLENWSDEPFHFFLHRYFLLLRQRNPDFSLRTFAKHLEVSPSTLSRFTNGIMKPSARMIQKLGGKIGLNDEQINGFIQVRAKNSASKTLALGPCLNPQEFKPLFYAVVGVNSERVAEAQQKVRDFSQELVALLQSGPLDRRYQIALVMSPMAEQEAMSELKEVEG